MYKLSLIHYVYRFALNTNCTLEFIYFFNTSSDEVVFPNKHGAHIYTCSQLYKLMDKNTIILATSTYSEQTTFFLSNLGYFQRSNKVLPLSKFSLETWKATLLIFNIVTQAENILLLPFMHTTSIKYIMAIDNYFLLVTRNKLFSNKVVETLLFYFPVKTVQKLLFASPFIYYVDNFYTSITLTKLSRLMALCSDKTGYLMEL